MFDVLLQQLAVVAVLVERVISLLKPLYQKFEFQHYVDLALSLVISAAMSVVWNLDVFAVAGLVLPWPYVGAVVTGVVAGLGSNVLHDLIELLKLLTRSEAKG